ncbi:MAG: helix-turn-helix domain-containing protein [Burkholderiaceae bacterium]
MPSPYLDPSNAHLKAAGQRLQDARLAQDISVDAVMRELKVTRMQIAGIESGNPKSFYNENFFVDLLKRYARLLNFSEAAIAKMVSPPVVEVVKPAEPLEEPTAASAAMSSEPAASTLEDVQPVMPPQASIQTAPHDADGGADDTLATDQDGSALVESETPRTRTVSRLLGVLAVMVLVGVGVAVGLQMTESNTPAPVVSVPTTTAPPAAPADGGAGPAGPAGLAADAAKPQSSEAPAANATSSAPTAAAPSPVPAAAPVKPDVVKPQPAKSPETKPAQTSAPEPKKTDDGQATAKSIVDTPMTLTAKQKSWIWVRDASDQVRQFGVAQGQTVKFDQLPIFIVVHDPSVFEVVIGNKSVSLARNAEDRNVARHTRTDLINFSKQ